MNLRRPLSITILISLLCIKCALGDTGNDEVLSPDGKYIVRSGVDNPHGVCCGTEVVDSATKQVLHTGYYNGYEDGVSYEELIWSPNKKYLAIISRGGKRSIDLHLILLGESRVDEVSMGLLGLLANISGRRGEVFNGHEAAFVSDFKWSSAEDGKLSFLFAGEIERNRVGSSTEYSYEIDAEIKHNHLEINRMIELGREH